MKPTTKQYPECGSTRLREFQSLFYKQCDSCLHKQPWNRDEGQKPLVGSSRDRYIITGDKS